MISRNTIDQVYETARVEEVIGDFVVLKKSGSNFKGLSPFSQERTPSFMVSPVKQIWKDFSSGKGGNVVAFLMEHEHFTYPEAIRFLAKKYNIEIEETQQSSEEKDKMNLRESLYLVNQFAQEQFSKDLWESTEGKAIGLSYFRERGFTEDTIRFFGLGYAAEQRDYFFKKAQKSGYAENHLVETGLVIKNERGNVDRFRGRVLFPIRSMAGRVQGFGGRILSSTTKTAKYLNSPESDVYHKSQVLYGIFEAKKAIAREDVCYLVEGYTDVIQMFQKGVENVVSSSGTALTPEQIRLIRRLTSNIVVLFDGDAAGLRAALRGIDLILEEGMNVRICSFPEGEDPDSFAKSNNLEEIQSYLTNQAKDFIQFKTDLLLQEVDNDPVKKATTVREIVQSIAKISDAIKQEIYLRECAAQMQVSEEVLFNALAQEKNKKVVPVRRIEGDKVKQELPKQPSDIKSQPENPLLNLEKQIVSILLHYGNEEAFFDEVLLTSDANGNLLEESKTVQSKVYEKVFLDLQQDEVEMIQPQFQTLYTQLIDKFQREGSVQPEKMIQQEDATLGQILTDILLEDEEHQLHQWEKKNIFVKDRKSVIGQLVSETILTFRRYLVDQKIQNLVTAAQEQEVRAEETELLEEVMQYQSLKKILSKKLNRVL
ncbi:DNA primase [Flavobacteriaceae bacterium]|nr:DNA primase [Flavobacteriaceae bacterium]MDA9037305.1 DNA primase [Flavobacteriaceae bacterium]MDC0871890.1 DNA primase [Flavobacteriaceae bacterium]